MIVLVTQALSVTSIAKISVDYNSEDANAPAILTLTAAVPTLKSAETMNYVLAIGLVTGLVINYLTMGKDIRGAVCVSKS